MKILVTSPYPLWPPYTGAAVRTSQIAEELAQLGHEVSVLGARGVPNKKECTSKLEWRNFPSSRRSHHFWNPSFRKALKKELSLGCDLLLVSYPYQAAMILPLAKRYQVPVVYDAQNVEGDRFRRLGRFAVGKLVSFMERKLVKSARGVLCVSEEDSARFKSLFGIEPYLLPNGVNPLHFFPGPASSALLERYDLQNKKILLFFGTFQYEANLKAAEVLVQETWPLIQTRFSDVALLLVGMHPPEFAKNIPGILVTEAVEDIASHIRLAHLVVCPLPPTGGTRLKILEALACGTPVLATPEAAFGFPSNTPGLEVVQARDFSARLLHRLGESSVKRYNTAASSFAEKYFWSSLVGKIPWESFRV